MKTNWTTWIPLVAVGVLGAALSCGSNAPAGYGATCDVAAECGGETPLCSSGACLQCTSNEQCGPADNRICDGDGFCAECGNNADCPATEPFCSSDGRCTECERNDDCGVARPVCLPNRGRCVAACGPDNPCTEGNELCHPSLAACVECAGDADCAGEEPLCDPDRFRCVECRVANDCGVASPFCIEGKCEECIQNTDCGVGQVCGRDLECRRGCEDNAGCDGGEPVCETSSGVCVECLVALDCPLDKPICTADNKCEN